MSPLQRWEQIAEAHELISRAHELLGDDDLDADLAARLDGVRREVERRYPRPPI